MANSFHGKARKAQSDKLNRYGVSGEYPPDRASRIAQQGKSQSAQGDAAKEPQENWTAAPARQVSDKGGVKGK